MATVPVALIQMAAADEPEANRAQGAALVEEAADAGARIVCLPELFASRYFCRAEEFGNFDLAEPIPGPTTERFAPIARHREIVLVVPVFERRSDAVFHNSLLVIDADGRIAGTYRKLHLPHDPQFFEKFYFTPGDLGVCVVETRYARIGALICWDQWFPEAARMVGLRGAEVCFFPTAIGWLPGEREGIGRDYADAWRTIQRSHAIANGLFLAAVNRVGREGEIDFWGGSFAVDPLGRVLAEGGDRPEIVRFEVDREEVSRIRREWPFFRDRRPDAYTDLLRRWIDE